MAGKLGLPWEPPPPTELGRAGIAAGSGQGFPWLPASACPSCSLRAGGQQQSFLDCGWGCPPSICCVPLAFVPSLPGSTPRMLWSSTCSTALSCAWEGRLFMGKEACASWADTTAGAHKLPTRAWACAGSTGLSWMESSTGRSIQGSSNRPPTAQTRAPTHEAWRGELTQKASEVNPDHTRHQRTVITWIQAYAPLA